jgi:excisionase family DNA binding protein
MTDDELNNKEPLTLEEAQVFTGLSRSALYHLVNKYKIPCYKPFGRRIYFRRSELEAFLFRNRHATNQEISDETNKILWENQKKKKRT